MELNSGESLSIYLQTIMTMLNSKVYEQEDGSSVGSFTEMQMEEILSPMRSPKYRRIIDDPEMYKSHSEGAISQQRPNQELGHCTSFSFLSPDGRVRNDEYDQEQERLKESQIGYEEEIEEVNENSNGKTDFLVTLFEQLKELQAKLERDRSECVLGHDERKERQLETHNTLEYELATLDQGNAELHRVLRTEETKSLQLGQVLARKQYENFQTSQMLQSLESELFADQTNRQKLEENMAMGSRKLNEKRLTLLTEEKAMKVQLEDNQILSRKIRKELDNVDKQRQMFEKKIISLKKRQEEEQQSNAQTAIKIEELRQECEVLVEKNKTLDDEHKRILSESTNEVIADNQEIEESERKKKQKIQKNQQQQPLDQNPSSSLKEEIGDIQYEGIISPCCSASEFEKDDQQQISTTQTTGSQNTNYLSPFMATKITRVLLPNDITNINTEERQNSQFPSEGDAAAEKLIKLQIPTGNISNK